MRFKLFSTNVYVSFVFMAVLTVMLAVDRTGLILPVIISVVMHEAGHLFAMWLLSCEPKQINLIPGSVQIVRKFVYKSGGEILIALSGPIVNILMFAVFGINYYAFSNETALSYACVNLLLAVFNLLPVRGVDGGTVIYNVLLRFISVNRVELIMNALTLIFAAVAVAVGVTTLFTGSMNISLILLGIYFGVAALFRI